MAAIAAERGYSPRRLRARCGRDPARGADLPELSDIVSAPARRRRVHELLDRIGDPPPECFALVINPRRMFGHQNCAFRQRLVAVKPEHQAGGAPDVDLGDHAGKAIRRTSIDN